MYWIAIAMQQILLEHNYVPGIVLCAQNTVQRGINQTGSLVLWSSQFCRKEISEKSYHIPGSGPSTLNRPLIDIFLWPLYSWKCTFYIMLWYMIGDKFSNFIAFGKYTFIILSLNIYFLRIYYALVLGAECNNIMKLY